MSLFPAAAPVVPGFAGRGKGGRQRLIKFL